MRVISRLPCGRSFVRPSGGSVQYLSWAERFTAFAVDTSIARRNVAASSVDIAINRWSPDADRDRLLAIFRDKGQDALLSELRKLPAIGYINTPGSLRYDLHFALQRPEAEGGRMIFLMTDRYITGFEAINRPRTSTIRSPDPVTGGQDGNGVERRRSRLRSPRPRTARSARNFPTCRWHSTSPQV
jgi:hypothetical protein